MYHNIPMELRQRLQWVCWREEMLPNGKKTKVPYTPAGTHASVTDPATWASFDTVVEAAKAPNVTGIGFVLTHADPYCIIDLDNKPEAPLSAEEWAVHERILNTFDSYTERSHSGRGYHIVFRGRLQQGRRRGNVEVYSAERYMAFTGDVVRNAPISEQQANLEALVSQMPASGAAHELFQEDGVLDDAEVHDMAMRAVNGAKYDALCRGDWQSLGYPSQSEADFALLSMLAFYTRDNEQVRRLFRYSALGKRDKAINGNRYIDTALRKIRSKEPTASDLEAIRANAQTLQVTSARAPAPQAAPPATVDSEPEEPEATRTRTRARAPVSVYPPGLVGEMAQYFYSTALRPVHEIAITAAIGLMAGVAGRVYNISDTGLNQYLLLIAKTGTGKEDGPTAIENLLASVRANVPAVYEFIGPSAFASGQALIRVLDTKKCFLSILGEFGFTLQAMNDPRAPASTALLKKVLLDVYTKSGRNKTLSSTAYSDSEKNTKTIPSPCVSFLGDTTPDKFYDCITNADIADGLIPRLQIIEYTGDRPPRNRNAGHAPPPALSTAFANLAMLVLTMQNNNACAPVQSDSEALALLDAFDEECDEHMRGNVSTGEIQLWNRAHLKALRLAALLAVGCDPHTPVIRGDVARWAIAFTRAGTERIIHRFDTGNVGTGDNRALAELRRMMQDYMQMSPKQRRTYRVKDSLLKANDVVPYIFLQARAARLAVFTNHRNGSTAALKQALETALQTEVISIVPGADAAQRFDTRQALYRVGASW